MQAFGSLREELLGFAPELALQAGHAHEVLEFGMLGRAQVRCLYALEPGVVDGFIAALQGVDELAALLGREVLRLRGVKFPDGQQPDAGLFDVALQRNHALRGVQGYVGLGTFGFVEFFPEGFELLWVAG